MTWLEPRALSALLAASLAAGCVDTRAHPVGTEPAAPASTPDAAGPRQPSDEAGPGTGTASAPSARSLDLSLSASPASICPGACSVLSVSVSAGRPPYAWSWDHDLPASEGPHRVCPSATTTYSVTVEDTATSDVEFPVP